MHEMRLHNSPFQLIKSGTKTIEMRLNDEKRQLETELVNNIVIESWYRMLSIIIYIFTDRQSV